MKRLILLFIIMLMACDGSSPLPSRAYVRYNNQGNEFINLDMVRVSVNLNGSRMYFTLDDFELNAQRGSILALTATDYFPTDTDGEIAVLVRFMDGDIVVAEGIITDQLREDWSMTIHIKIQPERPSRGWGYEDPLGFAISPAYIDSIIYDTEAAAYFGMEVGKMDSMYLQLSGGSIINWVVY